MFALWAAVIFFASASQGSEFPLKESDVVVMAGDSITAQHLHSNYIEAYCVTRFPKWNLQFRNSGVGGDTVPRVLTRLDSDVLCWTPTVVTIELGMNDSGRGQEAIAPYLDQMATLIARIRKTGARPVLLTSSPVNDIANASWVKRNSTLDAMATALAELAAREKIPCADQFHPLFDLWSRNLNSPNAVPLGGDAVHIGPVGHLTMAYTCLVGLDAPALVSEAVLNGSTGELTSATNCAVARVKVEGDAVSFDRADECLPMPIPDGGIAALKLVPISEKLNRYMLAVTGLKAQKYDVSIDGEKVATVGADELAKGWNMSELTAGPIAAQCRSVLEMIARKEALVSQYRALAVPWAPERDKNPAWNTPEKRKAGMAQLKNDLPAADAEIHNAAQPKPHHFEITPAK
jgi:lysophospholipase L1-like esterase